MPLLRFRLRTLMIAVLVMTLALWAETVRRRRAEYQRKALYYAEMVRYVGDYMTPETCEWSRRMAELYKRASRRPWLPPPSEPVYPD